MTATKEETFSASDVCRLTGLSYRQLDWWIRKGYIAPDLRDLGSGFRRQFTRSDVEAIIYIADRVNQANRVLHRQLSGELWAEAITHRQGSEGP